MHSDFFVSRLLHAVLVSLDHLTNHLTANAAGLTRGQITVVTLLQVDADLGWCTHTIKPISEKPLKVNDFSKMLFNVGLVST